MSNQGAVLLLGGAPPAQPGTPKHQEGRVQLSVHPSQVVPYSLEETRGARCCIGPPQQRLSPKAQTQQGLFFCRQRAGGRSWVEKSPFTSSASPCEHLDGARRWVLPSHPPGWQRQEGARHRAEPAVPFSAAGPCARVQQRAGHAPLRQPQCHLVGAVAKAGASAARDSQGWGEQLAVGAPHRSPLRCGIPSCRGAQGITSTGNTSSTQRRPTAEDRRSLPWRSIADVLQEHGSNLTGRFATAALVQRAPLPAMFVAARLKHGADSRTPWLCSTD